MNKSVFFKIGITNRTIKERFKNRIPYSYNVVDLLQDTPDNIFEKEKEILKRDKIFKYKPKLYFCGDNECFSKKPII